MIENNCRKLSLHDMIVVQHLCVDVRHNIRYLIFRHGLFCHRKYFCKAHQEADLIPRSFRHGEPESLHLMLHRSSRIQTFYSTSLYTAQCRSRNITYSLGFKTLLPNARFAPECTTVPFLKIFAPTDGGQPGKELHARVQKCGPYWWHTCKTARIRRSPRQLLLSLERQNSLPMENPYLRHVCTSL